MTREVFEALVFYLSSALSSFHEIKEENQLSSSSNITYGLFSYATAKSLQSCPTLCDPMDCSPPGSPSLGFSRQEHWSGVPLPSPVHGSEK